MKYSINSYFKSHGLFVIIYNNLQLYIIIGLITFTVTYTFLSINTNIPSDRYTIEHEVTLPQKMGRKRRIKFPRLKARFRRNRV